MGLGSHDPRVAMETAMLWFEGWADVIVFTGRSGNLTAGELHTLIFSLSEDCVYSYGYCIKK